LVHLGKYDILEELGGGGFGIVYKARDTSLNRLVALKVLHPQLTVDPKFIENFRDEAQKLAQVDHPNVVGVHEINEVEGRLFIVMRYLPGGSLADRIEKKELAQEETLRIIIEVAQGLSAGHEKGIIHRDVKPQNILFDDKGHAVVTDFGVARAVHQSSIGTTSVSSGMVGTPYYRPPELWRGKPKPSPATDVYSLGCVLYEMLTGEVLFTGETPDQVMTCHVLEDAKELMQSSKVTVPLAIQPVLEKTLSKDPSERYQNTDAFVKALTQSQGKQPVSLRPTSQNIPDQVIQRTAAQVDPTGFPKRSSQRNYERDKSRPVWKEERVGSEKAPSTGEKKEGGSKRLVWGAIGLVAVILIGIWIANTGSPTRSTEEVPITEELVERDIEENEENDEDQQLVSTNAVSSNSENSYSNITKTETPTKTATSTPVPDISFQGISMSFDREICSDIITDASKLTEGLYYEKPLNLFQFDLSNYAVKKRRNYEISYIWVFSLKEYSEVEEYYDMDELNKLIEILDNKPKNSDLHPIPWNHGAIFLNAKVSYFDFKNGRGIRFLGIGGQDIDTVNNTTLFYRFYGITNDDKYLISAYLPVTHNGLPDEQSDETINWLWGEPDNWSTYLSDSKEWLDSQDDLSYFPSLEKLDEMMASFEINP